MKEKQSVQSEKARRGWFASVVFMFMICVLIVFLSYKELPDGNRDILIGIIGMLTGSISSMLAIASGRDPSEVEELKDKLAAANGDRESLIARLRDSQIQMQLMREQISEIQTAIINKLSVFSGGEIIQTKKESDVILKDVVDQWTPKTEEEEEPEQKEDQ